MTSEHVPMRWPRGHAERAGKVKMLEAQLDRAIKRVNWHKPNVTVQCTTQVATGRGCGAWTPISNLVYIQTHWYTPPTGCTGGDYWNEGEGQWVCSKCGHLNRLYKSPEVEALKRYFSGVKDTYER